MIISMIKNETATNSGLANAKPSSSIGNSCFANGETQSCPLLQCPLVLIFITKNEIIS
jgi:hypothetical protein